MDNNTKKCKTFHLFAGAGGGILGDMLLGHLPVGACEISKFAREILFRRMVDGAIPRFPIWGDIRTLNGKQWKGYVDMLCGGFPCQAFSTAAHGKNIIEKDLWGEMRRIISEMEPRWVFAENVSKKAIDKACDDLEEMGFSAKAVKFSAADLGADHIRRRYWLLAHSNLYGEFCGPINAEAQGVQKLRKSVWETEPPKFRVDDGVAGRMDRIRAIGNGQIPEVVESVMKILSL